MVNNFEPLTLTVRGWVGNWVSKLDQAKAYEVTRTELLYGPPVTEQAKEFLRARYHRDVQRELVEMLHEHKLLMLDAAPIEEHWFTGAVEFRLRFLACERAPVPPVEDWGRFA